MLICFLELYLISNFLYAQDSKWIIQDGWVLKKTSQQNEYEKFFAIGLWGIPGYSFNKLSVKEEKLAYPLNYSMYKNKIKYFNLFYLQSGYGKQYMNDVVKMGGSAEFSWFLEKEYLDENWDYPSYIMMRQIEKSIYTNKFKDILKKSIDLTLNEASITSSDLIWAPFDEIASGVQNWCWPKTATDFVYSEIKRRTPEKLVYIDLLGSDGGIGNSYLFEEYYKKKHRTLPEEPPFSIEFINKQTDKSLLNFHYNSQETTIFDYNEGKRVVRKYKFSVLKDNWYESVKKTAKGYRNSGDIFGINSYNLTFEYPELVGVTVDAIKSGLGENKPVWIFFDSNGYAMPNHITVKEYVENLKCQMYTSLVHGATGMLFWSDLTKQPEVFNQVVEVIEELKSLQDIFFYETVQQKVSGKIHYIIKISPNKERYIVAVNTSTTESTYFVNDYKYKWLKPLEVYITKL